MLTNRHLHAQTLSMTLVAAGELSHPLAHQPSHPRAHQPSHPRAHQPSHPRAHQPSHVRGGPICWYISDLLPLTICLLPLTTCNYLLPLPPATCHLPLATCHMPLAACPLPLTTCHCYLPPAPYHLPLAPDPLTTYLSAAGAPRYRLQAQALLARLLRMSSLWWSPTGQMHMHMHARVYVCTGALWRSSTGLMSPDQLRSRSGEPRSAQIKV